MFWIFAIFAFIFVNLLLTLIFRAISEELHCQGSEDKWIQERTYWTLNQNVEY
jgi:hypothetical protein